MKSLLKEIAAEVRAWPAYRDRETWLNSVRQALAGDAE